MTRRYPDMTFPRQDPTTGETMMLIVALCAGIIVVLAFVWLVAMLLGIG